MNDRARVARVRVLAREAARGRAAPLPLLLALPEARPGWGVAEADAVARHLEAAPLPGPSVAVEVSPELCGHAGALGALELAVARLAGRDLELCLVGGVDSYLEADTLDWLEGERLLARAGIRGGFPPGEAAGVLALASEAGLARLGLRSLARVRGVGSAHEGRSAASETGLLGEGLTAAIVAAARDLRLPAEQLSELHGDLNGERSRTDDWGFTLLRTQHLYRAGAVARTAVGEWGDVGAATGALGCALAIQSWQRRYATGPRALVWAGSWGGLRAAAVLERGAE